MNVNESNIQQILDKLSAQQILVIDIEASGLGIMYDDFLCGIGVGTANKETYYFPFRHTVGYNLDIKYLKELLKVFVGKILIGHNLKFDLKGLYQEGFDYLSSYLIDTIVMARLCSNDKAFSLDLNACSERFLGEGTSSYKKEHRTYLKKNKIKRHSDVDSEFEGVYCCKDLLNTINLFYILGKMIKLTNQVDVWKQECKITKTLLNMEIYGVRVDLEYCEKRVKLLDIKYAELEKVIHADAGEEFNIASPPQLSKVMTKLGFESPVKTKKGVDSWGAKALAQIEHPIAENILEYRAVGTLNHTFFGPVLERGSEIVNTSFKNWKAITGRLSCEDPNLQNIPKNTRNLNERVEIDEESMTIIKRVVASGGGGRGYSVGTSTGDEAYDENAEGLVSARRLFIPRYGTTLFSLDYSQMEVAVLLYYGDETELLEKISSGKFDFHSFIAIEALGGDPSKDNFKFLREISKGITFGVIYGMGNKTLAVNLGKTINEAKIFRQKYLSRIPNAKMWMDMIKEKVENFEAIYNAYGRRYVIFPDMAYRAVNYMIQGTAGEIIKERMIVLDKFLKDKKSKMLIQIHDELLFEINNNEFSLLKNIVEIMKENKLGFNINVDVKKCIGSWASKEDYVIEAS